MDYIDSYKQQTANYIINLINVLKYINDFEQRRTIKREIDEAIKLLINFLEKREK